MGKSGEFFTLLLSVDLPGDHVTESTLRSLPYMGIAGSAAAVTDGTFASSNAQLLYFLFEPRTEQPPTDASEGRNWQLQQRRNGHILKFSLQQQIHKHTHTRSLRHTLASKMGFLLTKMLAVFGDRGKTETFSQLLIIHVTLCVFSEWKINIKKNTMRIRTQIEIRSNLRK